MKTLWRSGIMQLCGQGFSFLTFCCIAFLTFQTRASVSPFVQRSWHSEHGLPYDSVHDMVQTRDGHIWLGTRRGLARFDGVRFTVLKLPGPSLDNISSLLEARDGGLWIGTSVGIFRLKEGRLEKFGRADGVPEDDIRTICETKDGSIWLGRANGLTRFQNGKFQNFTTKEGLPDKVVRDLCEDGSGTLWIATDNGLARRTDGVISPFATPPEFGRYTRQVLFDARKDMWVGTQNGLFRRKENGWEHFSKMKSGLSDDFISEIFSASTGDLWLGTYGGLTRFVNGQFVTELTTEGAAFDLVNAIVEDHEGNFWIAGKEGVTRFKPRPLTTITKQQGLTYNNVTSVCEDRQGRLWAGTWGGGAFQLKDDKVITVLTNMGNNRVISICETRDGSLWFGTDFDSGLYRLKNNSLTRVGEKAGLETIGIRIIYEDCAENLWLGTARSLALLKDGKATHFTPKDGLAGEMLRVILETKNGDLWIGTFTGLSRRRNGTFTNFTTKDGLSSDVIHALHEDQDGNLWIGTGNGLNRLRDGKITSYLSKDGMSNDEALEILEDDFGHLWISSRKGIFRVRKKSLDQFDRREIDSIPCAAYGREDGMVSIICNNVSKPSAWKAKDGRLWFATTKGLVVANPKVSMNELPPTVVIEEIVADKKVQSLKFKAQSSDNRARSTLNIERETLRLPPGRGELEFHYAALSFQKPEKNRFKYKLEGVDPDWVDAGARREAYYNNIAPGDYTFRVIACNNDGVWNSLGANVKFTLLPRFWQAWLFKFSVALASLSFVAAAARYVTKRRMQQRLLQLEHQHAIEKERARIAKDIHDDLGASLTRITFLGELAETDRDKPEAVSGYVQRIVSAARDTVRGLDEIVWAVNPRNDTLDSLMEYIAQYVHEFFQNTPVRCRLDLPNEVPAIPLSSELRHNIFLVVKEALNNALKHAQANSVSVRGTLEHNQLRLEIKDDGRGFDLSKASANTLGNGLDNMRRRIEESGGRFELESRPGDGVRLKMDIPLFAKL